MSGTAAEVIAEIERRVEAEMPQLEAALRSWFQAHRITPKEIDVSSDTDGATQWRVWLVTDDIGVDDSSTRVVFDTSSNDFGLVVRLDNGVRWYMGRYGSLVATVSSM